jgi:hypothetical protein
LLELGGGPYCEELRKIVVVEGGRKIKANILKWKFYSI